MYELIKIASQADATDEAVEMHHAVGVMFNFLQRDGVEVYSLRDEGKRVLTISVRKDASGAAYCDHVVGARNRRPTEAEFMTLTTLLLHHGVELRYNPNTLC